MVDPAWIWERQERVPEEPVNEDAAKVSQKDVLVPVSYHAFG